MTMEEKVIQDMTYEERYNYLVSIGTMHLYTWIVKKLITQEQFIDIFLRICDKSYNEGYGSGVDTIKNLHNIT